jgi:hypothetical protein
MIKVDGNVATISIKNFSIGLHVLYLYFPDQARTSYNKKIPYNVTAEQNLLRFKKATGH